MKTVKTGRPQKAVEPKNVAKVVGRLGGIDKDLAEALGINRSALAKRDAELLDTLKQSKAAADAAVEKSLFQRAIGYSAPDTYFSTHQGVVTATPYTKHYPPSEVACIFWLKNRKPDQWREKSETQISGTLTGLGEDLVKAIQQRAAQKARAKANGSTR